MLGIAQQLFLERRGSKPSSLATALSRWPSLDNLLPKSRNLELAIATELLSPFPKASEQAAAFICHLCLAARQGHLCVRVDGNTLSPSPRELWNEILIEDSDDELLKVIDRMIVDGINQLPPELIGFPHHADRPLVVSASHYYLKRFWDGETVVIKHIERLLAKTPTITIDAERLASRSAELTNLKVLNAEQAAALIQAGRSSLTLITGGPGTGKTYVAGHLIQAIRDLVDDSSQIEIVATAPTGKAAANLTTSLTRVLKQGNHVSARTLHSVLGLSSRQRKVSALTADVIIVDESSMVDVQLMSRLLGAVKTGARVILLGDKDQLPAVEAGGIFADLVIALKDKYVVRLTKCHRTDSPAILNLAAAVREGNATQLKAASDNIQIHNWPDEETSLWDILKARWTTHLGEVCRDPLSMLQNIHRFRILTPLREGPWGVESINHHLVQWTRQQSGRRPFVLPIMIAVNDYTAELLNGDVGVLVTNVAEPYALFMQGDHVRTIPETALPHYSYAFALSVHKSQGSEFDQVLLLLPSRSEAFGREMLYTAITRARREIEIWSAPSLMNTLLQHRMERLSGLQNRLKEHSQSVTNCN